MDFCKAGNSFFATILDNRRENHFPSISYPRSFSTIGTWETLDDDSCFQLSGKYCKTSSKQNGEKFPFPHWSDRKDFKMENCKNYALGFHELFTISCSMLNEITLKRRFHSQNLQTHSCVHSCFPGVFSSSSFLQLRSKISNLGLTINTRMKRVRALLEIES